jgi:hypothetical protein
VPGGANPLSAARGRAGGHHVRERRRQLVEEVRVARGQVDGDRPRPRIRLDAAREVAPPRALMQRGAPTIPSKKGGSRLIRTKRSIDARKSSGLTGVPSE